MRHATECYITLASSPVSYSEGSWFKYQLGHWLVLLHNPTKQILEYSASP